MQSIPIHIRPNHPLDPAAIHSLWQRCFAPDFPLTLDLIRRTFTPPTIHHYTAWRGDQLVAFASVDHGYPRAVLQSFMVDPAERRKGIGTALHESILNHLKSDGVEQIQLGAGEPRIFPGVPESLPAALAFFQSQGWEYSEWCVDMVQSFEGYVTPPDIYSRSHQQGVKLELCTPARIPDLLAFVEREFPSWLTFYQDTAEIGDIHDLLLAVDSADQVIACLILYTKLSHPSRLDVIWGGIFGADMGSLGAVGTAESWRKRGIGTALIARGTEILIQRGATHGFIGWTGEIAFYGKIGYTVWQTYQMSWREL
jgi:GNAT superfamily N-acetyltransferase